MTNITDSGDNGRTVTSLVQRSGRGALAYSQAKGGGGVQANEHTVDDVIAEVDAGNITAQQALDQERAGKNRTTLISQLEARGAV